MQNTSIQLSDSYLYNNNTLYRQGNKVCVADIKDIHFFPFSKKVSLYMSNFIKSNFRDSSIKSGRLSDTQNNYITDGKKVYLFDKEIKGVDVDSFMPIYTEYSIDKNNVYCRYKKLPIPKEKFSFIE